MNINSKIKLLAETFTGYSVLVDSSNGANVSLDKIQMPCILIFIQEAGEFQATNSHYRDTVNVKIVLLQKLASGFKEEDVETTRHQLKQDAVLLYHRLKFDFEFKVNSDALKYEIAYDEFDASLVGVTFSDNVKERVGTNLACEQIESVGTVPNAIDFCQKVSECSSIVSINQILDSLQDQINNLPTSGLTCEDLPNCDVIQNINTNLENLQTQIDNLPTPPLSEVLATGNIITDGVSVTNQSGSTWFNLYNEGFGTSEGFFTKSISGINNGWLSITPILNKIYNTVKNQFIAPVNEFYGSVTKNGYEIATENFVDNRVQSNIKIIGDWDASSGSYPLADESNTTPFIMQWGTVIKAGWAFRVGYAQNGTVGGFEYENGDVVYSLVDNPTSNPSDWGDLDHNLQQATESLRGTSKIASSAIVSDETNTDDEKFITGYKLWSFFWTRVLAITHTFAAKITFTTAPRFSSTTGEQRLEVDANKDLISVAKGTADNKNFGENVGDVMRGEEILRMKSPFFTTTVVDHTANTTAASAVFSQLIPAGTLKAGDILRVQFKLFRISGTGSAWTRIYTSPTVALGTRIAQNQSTTTGTHSVVTRNFRIATNGLELTAVSGAIAFATDENVATNNTNELTYSFNVNADNYFHIAVEKSIGTDVYRLYYVYSQIIRP